MRNRVAYVSFDAVPSPKGASTHIEAFTRTLAQALGPIDLVTVSGAIEPPPPVERWPGIHHTELPALGRSLIDRVICFRHFLTHWLRGRTLEAIHFRSIFEGLPLLSLPSRPRLIFEVNGLPSIELKYRYRAVQDDRELMRKLLSQEQACLDAAHCIVTPSGVTAQYLTAARSVPAAKIRVIPNGVDTQIFQPAPRTAANGSMRLLYFGTLASWQGVDLCIRATAQMQAATPTHLRIIGPGSNRERERLNTLAARLGIATQVQILPPVSQPELAAHLLATDAVLAPLTLNDRNTVQGCCPLKILEGMAAAAPVIATDLPVVRELGQHGTHFALTRPGSVDHVAETALHLWSNPHLAQQIGQQARAQVEANYTWDRAGASLVSAYAELGINRASIT